MDYGARASQFAYGAAALLALSMFARWFERVNLYIPSRQMTAHPGSYRLPYEDLTLKAADGPAINAWYIPNRPDSLVMLVSHGNGGNISSRLEKFVRFHKAGASVLVYDYRGYGRSTGSPTEQGTYSDGEAAYRWLTKTKGVAPSRIVFYGESLGCGVAVELAKRHPGAGLILDSGFTSTLDMGRMIFPWLPVRWLVRYRYDNLSKLPLLRCPLLVMHSPDDDIIPIAMARRNFAAAAGPKSFFEMKGDHNEGFMDTGPAYIEAIRSFLASL